MISDATRPTGAIFFAGGGDRRVEGAQQLVCALQRAPCESGESRRAFAFECEEADAALGATQSDGDARPQFPSARPTRFFFLFYYYQQTASSLQPLHMPHWHCTDNAPPQARSESTTVPDHKHSFGVRPHLLEVSTINYNPARLIPEMASGL